MKTLGDQAFASCQSATGTVTIPGGVETIGEDAFNYCKSLTGIKIGYGVKTIGKNAFANCTGITTITIPGSVETVSFGIFNYCSSLASIHITNSLKESSSSAWTGIPSTCEFVNLKENPIEVTGKTATVKAKNVKKKNQTIASSKLFTFTERGQGALRFKKISGHGKITINSTTGKVTVKKKLKKGTYNINVEVVAIGNDTFRDSGWTPVTITIKVK